MKRALIAMLAVTSLVACGSDDEPGLESTPDSAIVGAEAGPVQPAPGAAEAGVLTPSDAGQAAVDATSPTPVTPIVDAGSGGSAEASAPPAGDGGGSLPPTPTGGKEPKIPAKPAMCPEIKTGMITVLGQQVQLTVGAKQAGKKGPIMFYWHGTGSTAAEARGGLGAGYNEILAQGGVIASFTTTTMKAMNTGNNVWYTGDFEMADQILACAIEQQDVDPRRVYTAGCSAGGLQASAMVYSRSSYLAAAMPNSGGTVFSYPLQDPMHVPAVIATHGAMGVDVVSIDFSTTTARMVKDLAAKGGFAVECDHGGRHCGSPAAVKDAQWMFLKEHYFGVTPEPYAAGLPATFPMFCKIIK
jgi:hypothetical protein